MTQQTVLVLEKRPRWTPELQRQFADEKVRVRSAQCAADLRSFDGRPISGPIILDLGSAAEDCLTFLAECIPAIFGCAAIVIGSQETENLEWAMRDAGVIAFLSPFVSGEDLAAVCRRHWSVSVLLKTHDPAGR